MVTMVIKSKSVQECATTHLSNQLDSQTDNIEVRDQQQLSGQEPCLDKWDDTNMTTILKPNVWAHAEVLSVQI